MNDLQSEQQPPETSQTSPKRKTVLHFWRCFWLTFLVASLAYAWHCFYVPTNNIAWAKDYASAQRQAAVSGKPIILYFTGTWCVPCRIMKRQVWADAQVMELVNADFVPVAIDVDAPENSAIMATYEVAGPPVTIVCDQQGQVLDWRAGGVSKLEFLDLLDSSSHLKRQHRTSQARLAE